MQRTSAKPAQLHSSILYLGLLICVKAGLFAYLAGAGFISASADEFSRGIRAAEWAARPRVDLSTDLESLWLPLEKYVNGLALLAWPDAFWAWVPRLTVFIASCLALIGTYVFVRALFDDEATSAVAGAFLVFHPWFTWLSSTPMLEMYYLAPLLWGLAFLVLWLRRGQSRYWVWAGGCFVISTGFHVQSWTFINLVNLLTLGVLVHFATRKHWADFARLVGFYFLGNAFILFATLAQFRETGEWFGFLNHHTAYSRWFYGGYNVAIIEKLLFYPKLIFDSISLVSWLLVLGGIAAVLVGKSRPWRLFPVGLAVLALVTNAVMNTLSSPPTAAPGRYSVFYVFTLSPYIAQSLVSLWNARTRRLSGFASVLGRTSAAALLVACMAWGLVRIPDYPKGMPQEALQVGYALNKRLGTSTADAGSAYMVELKYWDFLGIELTAGHYGSGMYDRVYNIYNRDTLSIFLADPESIRSQLLTQGIRYAAIHSPNLKLKIQDLEFMQPIEAVGQWMIYRVIREP